MKNADLYWLAGWLEGEGSFRAQIQRRPTGEYPRFHIVAHSIDEDVVRRAEQIAGYVSGPYGPYTENRQAFWVWQEKQRDKVFELITLLYPLMGERRQKQMDAMLSVSTEYPARYTGRQTVRRKRGA